jgi:hypothetical protein
LRTAAPNNYLVHPDKVLLGYMRYRSDREVADEIRGFREAVGLSSEPG